MPTYDFRCQKCAEKFSVFTSVSKRGDVKCQYCGDEDVKQLATGFYHTGSKSGRSSADCARDSCTTCPGCSSG